MGDPHKVYEIRCPVHGFIPINDWEREIIDQSAFQRLRRIRQLAWTDQVYPGAMHARFEHSLGVMHLASSLYDQIVDRSRELLQRELAYDENEGFARDRKIVRLTALLHDVGHAPFSHGAEELFPFHSDGQKRYRHEHYSAAIIRSQLRDVIENHPLNQNSRIKAEEVAALLEGSKSAGRTLFWRELIDGQMDADRMDYLLRDSLHCGVRYGKYDLKRLMISIRAIPGERGPRLGVAEGGYHAAESLVLARYFMFTQVYFHKRRVAFDHHLLRAIAAVLPAGHFTPPSADGLPEFLKWDNWRVLGALADGRGGEHGRRLATRDHYREVFHTPEVPTTRSLRRLDRVREKLGDLLATEERADKSWYKIDQTDIPIVSDNPGHPVEPLSRYSSVVHRLRPIGKVMLFCKKDDVDQARELIKRILERRK